MAFDISFTQGVRQMAKKNGSKLEEKLSIKAESSWGKIDSKAEKSVNKFSDDYKDFIGANKTEREVVDFLVAEAKKKGFKEIKQYKKLKPGDKVIQVNRNKTVALSVIGKKKLADGFRLIGSHIDSSERCRWSVLVISALVTRRALATNSIGRLNLAW